MNYGNTTVEVEEYKDCFIFYVDYNVPEELDEDGDGDWEHSAHIVAHVKFGDVSVEDGKIDIKKISELHVSDGGFYNSILDESESIGSENFENYEVVEIIESTISEFGIEFVSECLGVDKR